MQHAISKFLASSLLAWALAGGAIAHEKHIHETHPAIAALAAAPMPLAARFDLRINDRRTDWYLWREANAIETANVGSGHGEIWERQGGDNYGYRRVFHHDRKVVEYAAGELKTRHAEPDWNRLGSIISPQLLEHLKRTGSKPMFGQQAVRYVGRLGGEDIDLWWLEESRLPARLQRTSNGQRITMVLKELKAEAPAAWPRADEARIAEYGLIDASDFGDMESDPFVAKVLRQDGHQHGHGHAH